ncbi:hypothetical protein VNI00_005867 [Paramarasmius palmivorus]|uniref:Zn(2)-C6 fungal-type domain-containing protein n=1 Tax=Paramarasmius palmivorus TaxID=297713 RepID=A0AAW0DD16_9AGAR
MRRVRCDLKDLPVPVSGPNPSCSNCRERGLKCVDEFADVKAVKLLRRGRRLQQVEAIYGKAAGSGSEGHQGIPRPTTIPKLHPDFFKSSFWSWFSLQRPILDPTDFPARYCQGSHTLTAQAGLISMLLVVWAASYGLDEQGLPSEDSSRRSRRERTQTMLREVLEFIDIHAIMRSPSWDGLRVLFLILPLLDDESVHPLDRLAMHEASLSQVVALCSMDDSDEQVGTRARLFWYAYVQEGITTAIRGGRLLLNQDDLDTFAPLTQTQPTFNLNDNYHLPSPISPTFPPSVSSSSSPSSRNSPSMSSLPQHLTHLFSIPLRLSAICRNIHLVLKRKNESDILPEIWSGLDRCWDDFEGVRRCASQGQGQVDVQVERFVSAWQIFIFECHNVLREFLAKLRGPSTPQSRPGSSHQQYHYRYSPGHSPASVTSHPHSPSSASASPAMSPYEVATKKTLRLLPTVLSVIKYNLTYTDASVFDSVDDIGSGTGLFRYDTGLVRDGVFYAAFLCASTSSAELVDYATSPAPSPSPVDAIKQEVGGGVELVRPGLLPILDSDEGARVSLAAIAEMKWAFSKSEEREDSVSLVWEERRSGLRGGVSTAGYAASIMTPSNAMGMQSHPQTSAGTYVYPQQQPQPHSQMPSDFYLGSAASDVEMRYITSTSTSVSTSDSHFSSIQDMGMGHPSHAAYMSRQYNTPYSQVPSLTTASHSSSSSSHSSPEASAYSHLNSSATQHPVLPPLALNINTSRSPVTNAELSAGPNGHPGSWHDYTPPGTAHGSSGGSPAAAFKTEAEEFYAMAGVNVGVVQGVNASYLDF